MDNKRTQYATTVSQFSGCTVKSNDISLDPVLPERPAESP